MPSLTNIIEAILFAAEKPLKIEEIRLVFEEAQRPTSSAIQDTLIELQQRYQTDDATLHLKEVSSGWRLQINPIYSPWISGLFAEKPPKYGRATLETLALIAYRQPITRGEIEEIRGVAVNSQIIKNLLERNWIKELGQKEVPGRPTLFGTTAAFLDDFNLRSLSELPPLMDLESLDPKNMPLGIEISQMEDPRT